MKIKIIIPFDGAVGIGSKALTGRKREYWLEVPLSKSSGGVTNGSRILPVVLHK